ncbi:MAG: DNA starvation/stationary phase protection protein Dps [Janthinobacterium lividum]
MAKAETKNGTELPTRMYKNRVALSDDVKTQVVTEMNRTLAASLDMYSQAKFAHWNVKGINFYQLHLVFDTVAKTIFKQIDPIAERITQLGGMANGTVRQSAASSAIQSYPVESVSGPDHLKALADSLGTYCGLMREVSSKIDDIGDKPSADFFNQLIVDAEEELYFLESHMEAGEVQ